MNIHHPGISWAKVSVITTYAYTIIAQVVRPIPKLIVHHKDVTHVYLAMECTRTVANKDGELEQ